MEGTLEENVRQILAAGFNGVSMSFADADQAHRLARLIKPSGKEIEAQCFPRTLYDRKPMLELYENIGVHHLDMQAEVRTRYIFDCIPLIKGWSRLIE
jgi:hypothetical protein